MFLVTFIINPLVIKAQDPNLNAVFSPDGTKILTASEDGTAKLWDAQSGALIADLKGHTEWVSNASFSPDGKKILIASRKNSTAKISDAQTGVLLYDLGDTYVVNACFSPDGEKILLASCHSDHVSKVWDVQSGNLLTELKGHTSTIESGSFSPDGKRIVTTSLDNTAIIWDSQSGKLLVTLKGHTDWVMSACFSPDGKKIVTASYDNTAKVWDVQSGKLLTELIHKYHVRSACFSPDGKKILTISGDGAKIWDTDSGTLITSVKHGYYDITNASFSPDSKKIATASYDRTAKIWDSQSGELLADLKDHTNTVWSASFSPDGKKVLTASKDMTAKIWDAESGIYLKDISTVADYKRVLREHKNEFKQVPLNESGGHFSLTGIKLFNNPLKIKEDWYDAFVFKTTKAGYLYWAKTWEDSTGWYLLEAKPGKDESFFKDFTNTTDYKYTVQQSAVEMEADKEYIMWFWHGGNKPLPRNIEVSLNLLPANTIPLVTFFSDITKPADPIVNTTNCPLWAKRLLQLLTTKEQDEGRSHNWEGLDLGSGIRKENDHSTIVFIFFTTSSTEDAQKKYMEIENACRTECFPGMIKKSDGDYNYEGMNYDSDYQYSRYQIYHASHTRIGVFMAKNKVTNTYDVGLSVNKYLE